MMTTTNHTSFGFISIYYIMVTLGTVRAEHTGPQHLYSKRTLGISTVQPEAVDWFLRR